METKKILLFEPIFRGSRLHILKNVIESLNQTDEFLILTRKDYGTKHLQELSLKNDRIKIISSKIDLKGEWIRKLSVNEFSIFMNEIADIVSSNKIDAVFFMAIDDYPIPFFLYGFKQKFFSKINPKIKLIGFKYRVNFLLNRFASASNFIKYLVTNCSYWLWNCHPILFDERLKNKKLGKYNIYIIPDPWFGDFSPNNRIIARSKYGFEENDFVLLSIGKQVERKGFPFLLKQVENIFSTNKNNKLFIVGNVDSKYRKEFDHLISKYGRDCIIHRDEFVPEEELPYIFSSSDAVLMPYAPWFNATSGVLARASASGVPVIASDHGLIGFRVENKNLGTTFIYGNEKSFLKAIVNIKEWSKSNSQIEEFADSSHINSFKLKMKKLVTEYLPE